MSVASTNDAVAKRMGASALKSLVLEASRQEADQVDQTGILWLEHINLVVGSKTIAEYFYQDFLGLTRDPEARFHCNLGQQQFHLAETGDPAQVVTGSIGLVLPSLKKLRGRLDDALLQLQETQFKVVADEPNSSHMTVICPFGNTMHLYDLEAEQKQTPTIDSPHKMAKLHSSGGQYGYTRMGIRGKPGIRYVEITCPVDTSASIAHFYEAMLGCTVHMSTNNGSSAAVVSAGPGVHIVFREDVGLTKERIEQMKGVHLCIYMAPDFRKLYERLTSHNLIWTNPRFTHLDSCDTLEDAIASRTLRFKDVTDLATGKSLLELEHETRPSRHGQFMKAPLYEPK